MIAADRGAAAARAAMIAPARAAPSARRRAITLPADDGDASISSHRGIDEACTSTIDVAGRIDPGRRGRGRPSPGHGDVDHISASDDVIDGGAGPGQRRLDVGQDLLVCA
jgi:hypothetical protein